MKTAQKIMLKKYFVIGLINSFFLILSCGRTLDEGESRQVEYIYENNSSHNLKIKLFFKALSNGVLINKKDSIFINNGSIYSERDIIYSTSGPINDSLLRLSDSLYLIYDSSRILKLYRLNSQNSNYQYNIFNLDNFDRTQNNDMEIYKYIFTVDDYNEAQ